MKWRPEDLDLALDEALRDGRAVRAPEADDPRDARALRQALYRRAQRRGAASRSISEFVALSELSFRIEGTHVVVARRAAKTLRRPA